MVEWFGLFFCKWFRTETNWGGGRVFNLVMNILFHEKMDKFMKSFTEMSSSRNALVKELRWVDCKAAGMRGK